MKTLVSIVILRYRTIRSSKLLELQARAKIISMDVRNYRNRIFKILCSKCRKSDENIRKMKWCDVIKYSWTEFRQGQPYKSRDYFKKQLSEARDQIIKSKAKLTQSFQDMYSYKSIETHKQNVLKMCYYLFYIMLFLTVILMQLKLGSSFDMRSVQELLKVTLP